jgi:hypothetical protein
VSDLRKFRYEYPPLEARFIEAPSPEAVVEYIKRTYPHNFDDVLPTMVEISGWPRFWNVVDHDGRVVPGNA